MYISFFWLLSFVSFPIPEFTNPYGIRTTRPPSQVSSDCLSQFDTARDYPDFDMQNDLFWYKEKDEDYAMPFSGGDFYADKYVMRENLKNEAFKDYYELDEHFRFDQNEHLGNPSECDTNFLTKRDCKYGLVGGLDDTYEFPSAKKGNEPNDNNEYEFINDDVMGGEIHEPEVAVNEESGVISDELQMYATKEDEYEIFDLRIIHRKNRFVSN